MTFGPPPRPDPTNPRAGDRIAYQRTTMEIVHVGDTLTVRTTFPSGGTQREQVSRGLWAGWVRQEIERNMLRDGARGGDRGGR